ncbi:hypothetical protein BJ508DRAFT_328947 [Ascobolus immersus RN42]|uniref:Uncharacterized protein n=1 Tax=Ascobolus immersus RN42 TaxID=1160509 RepID=A0A3N4HYM2_ASCIM|nr:hypothetical protein BJ508DRAFT_328947 [Ascobolus immersus RN42]
MAFFSPHGTNSDNGTPGPEPPPTAIALNSAGGAMATMRSTPTALLAPCQKRTAEGAGFGEGESRMLHPPGLYRSFGAANWCTNTIPFAAPKIADVVPAAVQSSSLQALLKRDAELVKDRFVGDWLAKTVASLDIPSFERTDTNGLQVDASRALTDRDDGSGPNSSSSLHPSLSNLPATTFTSESDGPAAMDFQRSDAAEAEEGEILERRTALRSASNSLPSKPAFCFSPHTPQVRGTDTEAKAAVRPLAGTKTIMRSGLFGLDKVSDARSTFSDGRICFPVFGEASMPKSPLDTGAHSMAFFPSKLRSSTASKDPDLSASRVSPDSSPPVATAPEKCSRSSFTAESAISPHVQPIGTTSMTSTKESRFVAAGTAFAVAHASDTTRETVSNAPTVSQNEDEQEKTTCLKPSGPKDKPSTTEGAFAKPMTPQQSQTTGSSPAASTAPPQEGFGGDLQLPPFDTAKLTTSEHQNKSLKNKKKTKARVTKAVAGCHTSSTAAGSVSGIAGSATAQAQGCSTAPSRLHARLQNIEQSESAGGTLRIGEEVSPHPDITSFPVPSENVPISSLPGVLLQFIRQKKNQKEARRPLDAAFAKMCPAEKKAFDLWYNTTPSCKKNITPMYKAAFNWNSCAVEANEAPATTSKFRRMRQLEALRRMYNDKKERLNFRNLEWIRIHECGGDVPLWSVVLAAVKIMDAEDEFFRATGRRVSVNLHSDGKEDDYRPPSSQSELEARWREKLTLEYEHLQKVISMSEKIRDTAKAELQKRVETVETHLQSIRSLTIKYEERLGISRSAAQLATRVPTTSMTVPPTSRPSVHVQPNPGNTVPRPTAHPPINIPVGNMPPPPIPAHAWRVPETTSQKTIQYPPTPAFGGNISAITPAASADTSSGFSTSRPNNSDAYQAHLNEEERRSRGRGLPCDDYQTYSSNRQLQERQEYERDMRERERIARLYKEDYQRRSMVQDFRRAGSLEPHQGKRQREPSWEYREKPKRQRN